MSASVMAVLQNPQLHHVGIVVASEKQALAQMARLGLEEDYRGHVAAWDVLCIFAKANGGSAIEYVVPGSAGALRSFNNGLGGLHHLAFTVPDLLATSRQLQSMGVKLVHDEPVQGAGRFLCNFVPPVFTRSYAIELVQLQGPG
jgi:methylmalonyl-CoA/ethylmalonyl-CoA epimerase